MAPLFSFFSFPNESSEYKSMDFMFDSYIVSAKCHCWITVNVRRGF